MTSTPLKPSILLALTLLSAASRAQSIAITFDDFPAHSSLPPTTTRLQIATDITNALHAASVPPTYGFINAADLTTHPEDAAVLTLWRTSGNLLGSHTFSHPNLNDLSLADYEANLLRNEPALARYAANTDWHWFRFPFLSEGNTPEKQSGIRSFLADHHYKIAAVTMSFGDYAWNDIYTHCVVKNDTAAITQLEATYLKAASDDIAYHRALAQAALGHDIPYVLLMHLGAFDARMLSRLLTLYKTSGFAFVTLQAAESDPFYANDLDLTLPRNPDTLEDLLHTQHKPFPSTPHSTLPDPTLCR